MSKVTRLVLVALAGLLYLAVAARAESGVVRGQVVNGTEGAAADLGHLPVRLLTYSGDTLTETMRAVTDAHGVFLFEGVPVGPGRTAVAAVEYAGVEYESELLDLSGGTDFEGDILVYETTTDGSAVRVERNHLIVEMGVGRIEVTEMLIVENGGDRTYVGSEEVLPDRRATAVVSLPAGATDVSFASAQVAAAMVRTRQGFVDTRPLTPGAHEYVFSYALPCDGTTYSLIKPVLYPTTMLDVLLAAPGAEVEAPLLENLGTREAPGVSYMHLGARALSKGNDVVIRLRGLGRAARDQPGGTQRASAPLAAAREGRWLGIPPLLALVGLASALVVHLRRQPSEGRPVPSRQLKAALKTETDRLAASMAELDERYEVGELDEAAYRRQREVAKSELQGLMLSSQDVGRQRCGYKAARGAGCRADHGFSERARAGCDSRRRRSRPRRG
jgi:hypothetical protein